MCIISLILFISSKYHLTTNTFIYLNYWYLFTFKLSSFSHACNNFIGVWVESRGGGVVKEGVATISKKLSKERLSSIFCVWESLATKFKFSFSSNVLHSITRKNLNKLREVIKIPQATQKRRRRNPKLRLNKFCSSI